MTRFVVRVVLWCLLMFALLMSVSLMIGRGIHSAQLTFMTSNGVPQLYDARMNQALPLNVSNRLDSLLAWSPDGRYLAYSTLDRNARPIAQILRVYDTHTQATHNVPTIKNDDVSISALAMPMTITWSPDSTRLVYFNRIGQAYLYHVGEGTLTLFGENVALAIWSPTDERIATVQYVDERHWLIVTNADGTDRRRLLSMAIVNTPHWSPDGRYLIVLSGTNLLGEARLTLAESWHGVIREYGGFIDKAYPLSWSLDGRAVYYADTGDNKFYALDIDSGAITPLESPQIQHLFPPSLSPDGVWQATFPIRLNGVTLADVGIYLTKAGTDEWQAIARTNNFNLLWRP